MTRFSSVSPHDPAQAGRDPIADAVIRETLEPPRQAEPPPEEIADLTPDRDRRALPIPGEPISATVIREPR